MPEFRFDHVAVALRSIKSAVPLYRDGLGGEYLMGGDQGGVWRWLQLGRQQVEILRSVSSFLDKRGEGLHHVTFKTDDIRAAIDHLRAQGYELVDVNIENPHWKEAFLRPSKSHGTLIQIAQSYAPDDVVKDRLRPSNLDDLLR